MKLNKHGLGMAHAVVAGGTYLVCVAAMGLWPKQTLWLVDSWIHGVAVSKLPLQFGPLIMVGVGLVTFCLFAYIWGWLLAVVYNQIVDKRD